MTKKLSEFAGGGNVSSITEQVYDYAGTANANMQNIGYAGGKIEFFMRAKFASFTGDTDGRVFSWLSSSTSYWNLLFAFTLAIIPLVENQIN